MLSMERRKNERLSSANERRNAGGEASDSHGNNGVLDGSAVEESTSTSNGNESGGEVVSSVL